MISAIRDRQLFKVQCNRESETTEDQELFMKEFSDLLFDENGNFAASIVGKDKPEFDRVLRQVYNARMIVIWGSVVDIMPVFNPYD